MIKLSFVVPFYNVDEYISLCLESLYAQDIPEDEYEVICIDDCSPDNSKNIVLEYQKRHRNLRLISHSENKCLGGARNTGINHANGEYIWFVDSDDCVKNNSLKEITRKSIENKLDVLMFNFERIDHDGLIKEEVKVFNNSIIKTGIEFSKTFFGSELVYHLGYVWRQLYKTDFLRRMNIYFPENVFWEDTAFMPRALLFSTRALSVDNTYYLYRSNPSSISNYFNKKLNADLIFQFAFNTGKELSKLSLELTDVDIAILIKSKSTWYFNSFLSKLIKTSYKEKIIFFEMLEKHKDLIKEIFSNLHWFNKFLVKNPKVGIFLVLLATPLYHLKWTLKKISS